MLGYDRLTVRLEPAGGEAYEVYTEGTAGEAHGHFRLPFHERDLENFVLRMSRGRRAVRRVETPETARAEEFGRTLFDALFQGGIRDVYRESLAEARHADRGLRITLQLTQAPELMDVPWEYLYDEPSFLSISAWTPVVRYMDLARPRAPLAVRPPLRVLGMVSSPADCAPLEVEAERSRLQEALDPLIADGRVELEWTERASLGALLRALQRKPFHVFHYIGHGAYDDTADDGVLLLEGAHGGEPVSGTRLGTILCEQRSLRLAVLNACEGARTSRTDPYAGVAAGLVQRELPAVIAMQFEITDEAAIVFSEFFYDALALGQPVDGALAYARQGVYAADNDVEWATPVLLMRVSDGRLFDVDWERARADEPRMALQLEGDPPAPRAGESVTWRLAVSNVGESALSAIRAIGADGQSLAPPIDLASGAEGVITWTEPAERKPEHRVAVHAVAEHGEHLREEVVARLLVTEPEPDPDNLALTLECVPSSAHAGEDVHWRLALHNRGDRWLLGVTALEPDGRQLDRAADLGPGERHVLSWSAPTAADGRYAITVGATEDGGGAIVREARGSVEVLTGPVKAEAPEIASPRRPDPATERLQPRPPALSWVARVRPLLDHVISGAAAGVVGGAASFWLWGDGITQKINENTDHHKLLSDARTTAFWVLFWGVFAAVYAGCLAAARREHRSPVRAGFIGLALGMAGGLVGGVVRFTATREAGGLVLLLGVVGFAVGAAGALGASRATRLWSLAAGVAGGLAASPLLVSGRTVGGFGRLALYFGIGIIIAFAVGLAAQFTARPRRSGSSG